MRDAATYFGNYSRDHQNPTNQLIHWVCVPAITWTVAAFLWLIPVPSWLGKPGLWTVLTMFLAFCFYYYRLSRKIGLAMAVVFVIAALCTDTIYRAIGSTGLLRVALVVFVLAWIGQFIGHRKEGSRPSFLVDIQYLLIGPAWLMSKALGRFGAPY
jgi:uncharacterized membrane protein YGL010W